MAAVSACKKNEHNMSHNGKSPFKDLGKKGKVYDQKQELYVACRQIYGHMYALDTRDGYSQL